MLSESVRYAAIPVSVRTVHERFPRRVDLLVDQEKLETAE